MVSFVIAAQILAATLFLGMFHFTVCVQYYRQAALASEIANTINNSFGRFIFPKSQAGGNHKPPPTRNFFKHGVVNGQLLRGILGTLSLTPPANDPTQRGIY